MDATLLKFNVQPFDQAQGKGLKLEITYAAAHNCPFLVRNGECLEMPFDKMPVGKGELTHSFSTYQIPLEKGDMIYLGTDGYSDQFGGEKFGVKKAGGKKFKKSNLKKLLVEIANSKPKSVASNQQKNSNENLMQTQNSKLQTAFSEWKGDLEQIDDVCIIGIRI
jgi:serine phosphatase RsbU (regulator of sigma subunit)